MDGLRPFRGRATGATIHAQNPRPFRNHKIADSVVTDFPRSLAPAATAADSTVREPGFCHQI